MKRIVIQLTVLAGNAVKDKSQSDGVDNDGNLDLPLASWSVDLRQGQAEAVSIHCNKLNEHLKHDHLQFVVVVVKMMLTTYTSFSHPESACSNRPSPSHEAS